MVAVPIALLLVLLHGLLLTALVARHPSRKPSAGRSRQSWRSLIPARRQPTGLADLGRATDPWISARLIGEYLTIGDHAVRIKIHSPPTQSDVMGDASEVAPILAAMAWRLRGSPHCWGGGSPIRSGLTHHVIRRCWLVWSPPGALPARPYGVWCVVRRLAQH